MSEHSLNKTEMIFQNYLVGGLSLVIFFILFIRLLFSRSRTRNISTLPKVPEVRGGLPFVGNLLELKEKKPHKTFLKWAEIYGPIYSIKTGANTMIVLNNNDVAKEAMVTRYSSMSTRKLSNALTVLSQNKCMVAISDYGHFHKMIKKYLLTNILGVNAQKRHRNNRDTIMQNLSNHFRSHIKNHPLESVNFRSVFESELFRVALKQGIGKDVESVYVKELGTTLSREQIFKVLVLDMMEGAIEVDWRDFFPYLKWIPNKRLEHRIHQLHFRRKAVMNALIKEQMERIASKEVMDCYLDFLLSQGQTLTEEQIIMLVWETIIESADTTMVTTEWAMYELAKDPSRQDRLFNEIKTVCGSEKVSEEHLSQLHYLGGVLHETLRKHSPVPLVPLRYAHEDTQIGGYYISAGSEISINIYGCNMDKNRWESPEEWKPERFVDENYEVSDLYKTMAFGAGKRVCAGSLQASLVASTAISRLVQEFEWTLQGEEEEKVHTVGLTSRKLHPLHALLKLRNQ